MKNKQDMVSESIGLIERFAAFMGSVGKVAGAMAEASSNAAGLARQAQSVQKSVKTTYQKAKVQNA